MKTHNFTTMLFMSLIGVLFILIAFAPIVFNVVNFIENNYIKNNGIQITATISYKSIDNSYTSDDYRHNKYNYFDTTTYHIDYIVNGKKYYHDFSLADDSYYEGDIITVYCLSNDPEKVYVPLGLFNGIFQIFIIFIIFFPLGYACLKYYNVFKYEKFIYVKSNEMTMSGNSIITYDILDERLKLKFGTGNYTLTGPDSLGNFTLKIDTRTYTINENGTINN